nr:hypothetical protein [Tanacetum cinerariifolium]
FRFRIDFEISYKVSTLILLDLSKGTKPYTWLRVHIITLTTIQMFLSVDKKYPLTHFTLEQMLNNVRLKVEEESEMSFELLRLVRRQLNEGLSLGSFRRVPSYTAIVPCLTDVETIEFGPGISSKGSASLEYCFGPNIFA